MDIFGVTMMGTTTAVGGGIIRDVIIGVTPPVAFQHPIYAILAILVSIIVFLPYVRSKIKLDGRVQLIMDSIGLGVFTVVGIKAGANFDNLFLQLFLGSVTGVGGGVMRDVFAGDKPRIFVKHFYASSSIIGALVCVLLWRLDARIAGPAGAASVFVTRLLAAKYKWQLPKA